jgi:PKD repeat protein
MMGLIDGINVPPLYAFAPVNPLPCGQVINNVVTTVTIEDIQSLHGIRTPGPTGAKRDFRIGFVAESNERLLNPTELTFYEILAGHYTNAIQPEDPDPYLGFNWVPITRFFGEGTTWKSSIPLANLAPILNPIGPQIVDEGELLNFTVSGSDFNGDPLTYSATGLPTGATFDPATQTFSWTPDYTQAGLYSVTFTVNDGSLTDSETVPITVNNVNRAPVLNPIGPQSVYEGQLLSFTVSGSDLDGDALTYTAAPLPAGVSFDPATHTFSWTPDYNQAGMYNVTFTISDGNLMDSEVVPITVNEAPSCIGTGSYKLSGTVKTEKKAAIPSVTMTVIGPDACFSSTTTDSRGQYRFTNLGNGTYTITPSKSGYIFTPSSQTKTISGNHANGVNFTGAPTP